MTFRLYASRFNTAGTTKYEQIEQLGPDTGFRWSLPFGLQKFEVGIRAASLAEAKHRARTHYGDLMILHDQWQDTCIAYGWVAEILRDGRYLKYVCGGPQWRHTDDYEETEYLNTDTTTEVLTDVIANHVPVMSTDISNIDANATAVGNSFYNADEGGEYPRELIKRIISMSDSSNNQWDYWAGMPPLNGALPGKPLPYYKARSTTASADWLVENWMLNPGRREQGGNIWKLATDVRIKYARLVGTHDGANNSAYLEDSTVDFEELGVLIGDKVRNTTDGGEAFVQSFQTVGSGSDRLNLSGLTGENENDFDTGDGYEIVLSDPHTLTASSTATATYWSREIIYNVEHLNATQAGQLAAQLVELYSQPVHSEPISIGSRYILSAGMGRVPLWRTAINGGYIRALDFELAPNVADQDTFIITALDYTYGDNVLRVVFETPDARLDRILSDAGVGPGGEAISSGGRSGGGRSHRRGGGTDVPFEGPRSAVTPGGDIIFPRS